MVNKKCPCAKQKKGSSYISCKTCDQWWHAKCVSLKGLSVDDLKKLTDWDCPICYVLPENAPQGKLEALIKSESNKITARLQSVEAAVAQDKMKMVISEVVKENLDEQVNSLTEVVSANSDNTRRVITESIQRNSQKVLSDVVKSSKAQVDSDAAAREQRKCNLIIRKVTEPTGATPDERRAQDTEFVQDILNVDANQIIRVTRAGPPIGYRQDDNRSSRPIIVTMETPELASYMHNHGRGWKRVDENNRIYWVNPDLIQVDREANYNARVLAQTRRQGRNREFRSVDRAVISPTSSHHSATPENNSPIVHANRVPLLRYSPSVSYVSSVRSQSPSVYNRVGNASVRSGTGSVDSVDLR